jgi:hypothetical protein
MRHLWRICQDNSESAAMAKVIDNLQATLVFERPKVSHSKAVNPINFVWSAKLMVGEYPRDIAYHQIRRFIWKWYGKRQCFVEFVSHRKNHVAEIVLPNAKVNPRVCVRVTNKLPKTVSRTHVWLNRLLGIIIRVRALMDLVHDLRDYVTVALACRTSTVIMSTRCKPKFLRPINSRAVARRADLDRFGFCLLVIHNFVLSHFVIWR